jgi:tyrosine-protein phosphatase non-receptor type 9
MQGPLPATVQDFWRMVAVTNTSAIVMLTGLSDGSPKLGNSKPRCAAYFPENEQDTLRLPSATVTCVHKNSLDENVHFRQLEVAWSEPVAAATAPAVTAAAGGPGAAAAAAAGGAGSSIAAGAACAAGTGSSSSSQQVQSQPLRLWINHYEYAGWPDYGVPPTTGSVLALCHALDGCRRAGCKIVVHCSAGVGRTGTFIATDVLLQRLHSLSLRLHGSVGQQDVVAAMNVPELVVNLRQQRRGMVQTWEQYRFVWEVCAHPCQQ